MSGGIGPTGTDITLPQEQEMDDTKTTPSPPSKHSHIFLNFRQLNSLAVILLLSATGMVSLQDFLFVLISFLYIFLLSKLAFPSLHQSHTSPVFNPNSKTFKTYIYFGALIGLFLPIAYILEGIFEGDQEGIRAAVPHVFLLSSQIFMEGVASSDRFSLPIRVLVPVFYNSKRLLTIADWFSEVFYAGEGEFKGSARRLYVGRGLAVGNMVFWSFNLFCFLLPVYLPRGFKQYYTAKVKD